MRGRSFCLFVLSEALFPWGCAGGWVGESTPTDADLYGVYGFSNGQVFAVGDAGTVLLRDRGRWRKLNSGSEARLRAVWGSSETEVVAVGDDCAVLRYSGPVEPPAEGEPPPDLQPVRAATCGNFRDIDGPIGEGQAFVVGERTASQWYSGGGLANGRVFSERMQGASMQIKDQPFACGDEGVLYWREGGSWKQRTLISCGIDPQGGSCPEEYQIRPVLWDVWVGSDGTGALVGSMGEIWLYPPPAEGEWNPVQTGFDAELRAASGYVETKSGKTVVYAAGYGGVLVRIGSGGVSQEAPGTHENLYGIWVSPDGKDIYAVGAGGTVLHYK